MLSWAHKGLAGSSGVLLIGWLVVLAHGLYRARHQLLYVFALKCYILQNTQKIIPFFPHLGDHLVNLVMEWQTDSAESAVFSSVERRMIHLPSLSRKRLLESFKAPYIYTHYLAQNTIRRQEYFSNI